MGVLADTSVNYVSIFDVLPKTAPSCPKNTFLIINLFREDVMKLLVIPPPGLGSFSNMIKILRIKKIKMYVVLKLIELIL